MSHGKTFAKQGDVGLTKKMITDNKVTVLENRIKEKIEVMSGFVDDFTKCRKLEAFFKYFDKDGSGNLNYQEFFSAMMKFNLIGVQRECEALFNRFDDDCNGTLNYKEMCQHLYGFSGKVSFDSNSTNIVERVKARIIEQGGASGIHGITRMIARITKDFGQKTVDRNDLHAGLINFGITGISNSEMDKIFDAFDRDGSGRISSYEFLRGLKGEMPYERKQMAKSAFKRLSSDGEGKSTLVKHISDAYDPRAHPCAIDGTLSIEQARQEMLHHFQEGENPDGVVLWSEFLDYYKGISISIDEDKDFELLLRNSWYGGSGGSKSVSRRVVIVHKNGQEEVVEINDDLAFGGTFNVEDIKSQLYEQGIDDIIDVRM